MDALTLGDAGSRGQRCERYPLLLLLLDKESGESGGEEARGGGAGRGRCGYGVAEGACGDDGGGGAGGYRRFDHEGGRGGQRLARGAAALLGSWPRHLMVALVAALAVGFALLVLVVLSAWLAAPAARPRASRYCDGGACGQVEMVSVEEIGPRRCQRPDTTTADIFPTIVTQRPKTTQPQSAPHRKGERSWAWRRFMGHALPAAKTAAREQAAREASVRSSSWPRPAIAEDVESFWELGASPWTAPSASTEEASSAGVKTAAAARPERPVSFVVGDGDPLTREQVCALESAARFNPRSPVHVLVLSPHAAADDADAAARPAHWPAPRDARSAAAAALHAVLRAYHGAIQVVAVGEELFSRSPLQALWERARARLAASAEEDGDSDVEGEGETEGEGEGEARFGAALRLGARLLALWEFGGMALEPSLLSLRNASADDLHTKRYYTDAVRLDTKEALVLSVSEVCHPLVFELLRALAAVAAERPAEGATQEALLRQAVTRALPEFCRGAPGGGGGGGGHAHASTAALEEALAAKMLAVQAAAVPESLLCRRPIFTTRCAWVPASAAKKYFLMQRFCPIVDHTR